MKKAIIFFLVLSYGYASAQVDISRLVDYCDSAMQAGVDYPMIPGGVLGIASSDSILLLKGYGYSDFERKVPASSEHTFFQIGSVGKLMTSIALLQLVDENKITLNDDVNAFLTNWEIENPFNQSVTPFHLLTHSAGFNDQFIGYMARSSKDVKPLSEHLPEVIPSIFKAPGTEINYSNYSYALAGHIVEQITGKQFENHIEESIFQPLVMEATYDLPDDYLDKRMYANGYILRDTFIEKKMYPRHATPAGSVLATGKDMVRFAQALLRRDSLLLSPSGYDLLFSQQFTNHPSLTGYTMGMEVQNFNGTMAYSKGGQVSGFLSVLVIFPSLDLSLFISVNTQTDNHPQQMMDELRDKFFPSQPPSQQFNELDISPYAGNYANERCNHETIEEMFSLFRGHFAIYPSDSSGLSAYHDGRWHKYQYVGDDLFQDIEDSNTYIAFKRNIDGKIESMYRNVNVAGVHIPASYRKLNWFERPRFINDEYPYALLVMMTYILLPIMWIAVYIRRKRKPEFLRSWKIEFYFHAAVFLFIGLFLWNVLGFFVPLIKLGEDLAFGLPESLQSFKYFNWAMLGSSIVLLALSIQMWVLGKSTNWFRMYYSIISLISFSYILMLHKWHLFNISI